MGAEILSKDMKRAADALERIAKSLETLATPMKVVNNGGGSIPLFILPHSGSGTIIDVGKTHSDCGCSNSLLNGCVADGCPRRTSTH